MGNNASPDSSNHNKNTKTCINEASFLLCEKEKLLHKCKRKEKSFFRKH